VNIYYLKEDSPGYLVQNIYSEGMLAFSSDGTYFAHIPWASTVNSETLPGLAVGFYKNGSLLKSYSVGDLTKDRSRLYFTASHVEWERGEIRKLDAENNILTLMTLDDIVYSFDMTTGDILNEADFFQYSEEPLAGEAIDFKLGVRTWSYNFSELRPALIERYYYLGAFSSTFTVKYNVQFFTDKALIFLPSAGGPSNLKVDSVVKTGDGLGVNVSVLRPELAAQVVTYHLLALEIDKADLEGVKTVLINYKNESADNLTVNDLPAYTINAGTTLEDYIKGFTHGASVYNWSGEITDGKTLLGTGSIVNAYDGDGAIFAAYRLVVRGDVDGDGSVTAADARITLRCSSRLTELNSANRDAADVDGDGSVTAADARQILRVSSRLAAFD